ncbi:MAG: hypothetical protein U0840_22645 [Gemmataceae bacterium]
MLWRTSLRVAILSFLLVVALQSPLSAQRLDDGQVAFEDKARPTRILRQQLFKGDFQADPRDKNHLEAIEIAAKEVTYPLHWKTMAGRPKSGEVNQIVEELDSRLMQMSRFRATTMAMQQLFTRQVIDRIQEVIQNDKVKPIASINAARMLMRIVERRSQRDLPQTEKEWTEDVLPRLAEGNAEQLAVTTATLLEDPRSNDGVRYYLYRAANQLLSLPKQSPPLVKSETEARLFAAAVKQIEKKVPFPKATPRQDVDGYRILRREAIRLLAQARLPVVGKDRVGLVLARVAGQDASIIPPPRLDERIEASIGLAHMGAALAKFPDFHMDYAAAQIARTVVEFGAAASPNLEAKPNVRLAPWKVDAARLGEAIETLRGEVKLPYVQQATDQCLKQVTSAIERGTASNHNNLRDWLSENPPMATSLFKGDETTVIKPGAEAPAAAAPGGEPPPKDEK